MRLSSITSSGIVGQWHVSLVSKAGRSRFNSFFMVLHGMNHVGLGTPVVPALPSAHILASRSLLATQPELHRLWRRTDTNLLQLIPDSVRLLRGPPLQSTSLSRPNC